MVGICPKCKKKIDHLDYCQVVDCLGILKADGELEEHEQRQQEEGKFHFFNCPECDEFITDDLDEAREFLEDLPVKVYWGGELTAQFHKRAEAETFIHIESQQMEFGDMTPEQIKQNWKIEEVSA
jgi:hypothetical protein